MRTRQSIVLALFLLPAWPAFAVPVSCYTDPSTDAKHCYVPSKIREVNGVRTSPYVTGGPKAIRETNFTIAVNCATQVAHLKDRDGVSFAGGDVSSGTRALRSLATWMCEEKLPAPKKK